MIPLLGITVSAVNIKTFESLIQSIDYPVDRVSILCNNSDFDYFLELKNLSVNSFVNKFIFSYCPYNLGCAGGWNYHIKNNSDCNYWLLSNDDIVFGKNDLCKFHQSSISYDLTFNRFRISSGGKYSLFSLSSNCVEKVGLFDENFYPVYYEDDDYDRRLQHHNLNINYVEVDAMHMHEGTMKSLCDNDSAYIRNVLWNKNRDYLDFKANNNILSENIFLLQERKQKIFEIKKGVQ
jgi:GT2 family glycosyltransferase